MRYQGDGKCLLGQCSEGYKCDCLAYETCQISKCPKYTTMENVIPSAETPFLCHLTENAGTCINFVSFVDTLTGVDVAKQDATQSVTTVNIDMRAAIEAMDAIQDDKTAGDALLQQIDAYTTTTDTERAQVEHEVSLVMTAMAAAMNEASSLQSLVTEVDGANNIVAHNRLLAYSKEQLAVEKEAEAEREAQKPENKDNCLQCVELNAEARRLRREQNDAIKEAGRSAQRARAAMHNAREHGKNLTQIRQNSAAARARAADLAGRIMERARNAGQLLRSLEGGSDSILSSSSNGSLLSSSSNGSMSSGGTWN